jgi:hypothetical protein
MQWQAAALCERCSIEFECTRHVAFNSFCVCISTPSCLLFVLASYSLHCCNSRSNSGSTFPVGLMLYVAYSSWIYEAERVQT